MPPPNTRPPKSADVPHPVGCLSRAVRHMTWAAVLAAVVSILAAITAAWQARSVTRLTHKILALDRQAEQLRDDYRDLFKAIGDNTESMVRYRSITAAGEVLRAHP